MKIMNIGIVAHVDAGKTSLTERILFETNVINEIGKVDHGNTQTDSMDLERRRGITIKASVVSFFIDNIKVNLIDTPGHADFIAEVERSFSVLDGVVLVISAVEGVQAQTKVLVRVLKRLGIPIIFFINKIDREGARSMELLMDIKAKLTEKILPFQRVEQIGTKEAYLVLNRFNSHIDKDLFEECIEVVSEQDESLLERYLDGEEITEETLSNIWSTQTKEAKLYPVFFGSAITGVGVKDLLEGVKGLFPVISGFEDAPLSAVVFKIEKEPSGEKVAYVRVFTGSIKVREYVQVNRKNSNNETITHSDKIKKLHRFYEGKSIQVATVGQGDICKIWGFNDIKIHDVLGVWSDKISPIQFTPPQLETLIEAKQTEKSHQLYQALMELSEEDPLIQILKDDFHRDIYIRLFGEVQKEVIETLLKENHGLDVSFSETRVVCIEKPKGIGQAVEIMGSSGNIFYATVGFKIEPGITGSGISYQLGVELGSLPLAFHKAIEDTVFSVLMQGIYGWEVTDIVITLTHSGYASPVTTASDFRKLVPLVLMEALAKARTEVYEPMEEFELTVPIPSISKVMYKLSALHVEFEEPILHNDMYLLTGILPMAVIEDFKGNLQSLTEGEGSILTRPAGFKKIMNDFPTRKRADFNPLNKKEYLLHVMKAY
ncbi:tetracycline resistance protein [Heyndrickxia sporothermodurans]|nr:tetracycline resistance protein [Heyndrickxia sporothermodurans]